MREAIEAGTFTAFVVRFNAERARGV
jgi:hypothetical protein